MSMCDIVLDKQASFLTQPFYLDRTLVSTSLDLNLGLREHSILNHIN